MLSTIDSVTQLYRIDLSSEWPTEISSVSTLLDVPIPVKILDSSCSSLSQRASRLLSELSELFLHSSNKFGHGNSSPEMLEMLDLILSTVCMLRSIAGDDLRTTTPFWSLLIRSLAYVCHDKSYIIEDAPFVCARLSRTRAIRPDGHAYLLISHLAEELELPEHDVQDILPSGRTDAYSEGSYDEGDESSIFDSDSNIGSSYHSENSTDLTSVPSCHIPLDAHVLAYWQRRDAAALPFLCVTDQENILPLIESTLYQRYTWGIDAPVVGIVISKTGCIVRVVFGWIGASVKPHALPIIHVANSDKESSDSSLGIYDLTDPVSALQLAQFILGLRTHVKKIVQQCPRSTFRPFSWRSGCIDGQHLNGERWETRIHSWLSDIPQPRENRMLATHAMSSLLSLTHEMSRSRSTTSSNHQHSSHSARSTSLSRSEGKPPPAQRGRTVDRSGGKRRSTSCSALGRKAVEGIAPTNKLSWGSYSHDRKVISLAAIDLRPSHSNDTVATDEINRMKAVYDQLTGYQAPPWESIGDMPTVDRRMNVIRDHFFKQMKECPRDTTLCTEHTITIADSFSSLCWASVGGFSKMVAQQETNETEARHDWDFLMYLMYLSQSDINPSRPLLERTISLSQNIVVDSFNEPDFVQSFMTCARESVDLNERTVESAKQEFTNMSEAFLQANEAYNVSIKHAKAVDNLFKSKTVEIDIRNRADIEPKTAVCDIILPFPLDALQIVSEPLIKIAKPKPDDDDAANGSERGSRRSSVSGATKSTTSRSLTNILEARSSSEEREELMTTLTASVAQNGHALPEEIGPEKFQSSDLQDPFSVNCSETKNAGSLPPATVKMVQSLVGLLLLAVLVGEYKKYSDRGFMKPLVQTRIYVEASCRHLASLGITDHPVFGLATNGCEGAVLMGWYSQAKDVVYLMERNIRTFNISSPIQVYHFATFVLRLRDYSQSVLKTKALQALGNAATFEQKSWTKQAQNDRLGLDAATPA